jgi:hypothetical protein
MIHDFLSIYYAVKINSKHTGESEPAGRAFHGACTELYDRQVIA